MKMGSYKTNCIRDCKVLLEISEQR